MTTLKQEWALVEQDQENAVGAFKALCKARYALHKAAKAHAIALDWVSFGHTGNPMETHIYVCEAGAEYRAAKQAWLDAA